MRTRFRVVKGCGPVGGLVALLALTGGLTCMEDREAVPSLETHAAAVTVPTGLVDESFAAGIDAPTQMEFAPDGRLFVSEQRGRLRVIKNGTTLATPFVTLSVDSEGERGLLGVAFDPGFASNGFVYLYYTTASGTRHNRLSRFTANGDVAVAGSEVVLVDFDPLSSASNHNGGAVHVGGDGKLYVAVGDNATSSNAQTLGNRLGKLHRYNLDGSIPSDNPFFASASGANRSIWALGLRNPFTFAVQPGTGVIFINDVGQSTWEEVNRGAPAANYAWPRGEGPNGNAATDTKPIYAYDHSGGACSIAGGTFYNPPTPQLNSAWVGHYFFADYCAGWIRRLDPSNNQVSGFATGLNVVTDLKTGADGALYYLSRGGGEVRRIRAAAVPGTPPQITAQPSNLTVAAGQSASFAVAASGSAPLAYQWQRNGSNIAGATGPNLTLNNVGSGDNGAQFRAVVSNAVGTATSGSATLTVLQNQPPTATITAPTAGTLYAAGQIIAYAGSGQDAEDGSLSGAAFTWEVVFHHDVHTHPFVPATTGATSGSFTIPTLGETATNVWYRIHLRVRDSAGLITATSVDVRPRVANLSFQTVPAGLQITLDGQTVASGTAVPSVVGMVRALGAPSPQTLAGKQYQFGSWSDGGGASHDVATPAGDATFVATFTELPQPPEGPRGLTAEYFDNRDLTNLKVTRVDPAIDFDWARGAPAPGVGAETFSVRWTGTVTPNSSETYTFTTRADDGIRFFLDGIRLIDNWRNQSATERSVQVALTAGRAHAIRVEYYDNTVDATARLFWSSPSIPRQIVPTAVLRPVPATAPPPSTAAVRINFQLAGVEVPNGYLPDSGAVFGDRGGTSYGWNRDHSDFARDREINPDQRLDTFCYFHQGGVWELAIANGTYQVTVSAGDARDASTNTLNVEGTSYFARTTLPANQFSAVAKSVTVTDGRLTIDAGASGEKVTRINYVEIATP